MPTTTPCPGPSRLLRPYINVLGALTFAGYAILALMSYAQAGVLWRGDHAPRAERFFNELWAALPLSDARHLLTPDFAVFSYVMLLAVPTTTVVILFAALARGRRKIHPDDVNLIFGWSVVFAMVGLLAFPVFTQDFWLSSAWGKMIVHGANPYHEPFTPDAAAGLPLDHFSMVMSYGPLWAILSGAIMALAGDNVLIAGLLFKLVLAGAWLGVLVLVRDLGRARHPFDRCVAMLMVGWTPLSVTQTVFEGHNDIIMIGLALLWALLLIKGQGPMRLALVASVAVKYVTVLLFLADFFHEICVRRQGLAQYVKSLVVPALTGVFLFSLFFRSTGFFDGLLQISGWHFLQPDDAVKGLEQITGLNLPYAASLARAVFPVIAVYCIIKAIRQPGNEETLRVSIALLAAASFALINHLWPWYVIWSITFAAAVPGWWLSRFIHGVAIIAPFTLTFWWIEMLEDHKSLAALALYTGAIAWAFVTRSVWDENKDAELAAVRADTTADDTG